MHACSPLGAVRAVQRRGESLLALRTLTTPDAADHLGAALATLGEAGEQLSAAAPFPLLDGDGLPAVESATEAVVETVYESGRPAPEAVDRLGALRRAGRVEVAGDAVVVPLGRAGGPARNWYTVMGVLADELDGVAATFERVAGRLDGDAAGADPVVGGCRSVLRMLASLRDVLAYAASRGRAVASQLRRGDDGAVAFAEWTAERLGGSERR